MSHNKCTPAAPSWNIKLIRKQLIFLKIMVYGYNFNYCLHYKLSSIEVVVSCFFLWVYEIGWQQPEGAINIMIHKFSLSTNIFTYFKHDIVDRKILSSLEFFKTVFNTFNNLLNVISDFSCWEDFLSSQA